LTVVGVEVLVPGLVVVLLLLLLLELLLEPPPEPPPLVAPELEGDEDDGAGLEGAGVGDAAGDELGGGGAGAAARTGPGLEPWAGSELPGVAGD
jgi:hypothetical protein